MIEKKSPTPNEGKSAIIFLLRMQLHPAYKILTYNKLTKKKSWFRAGIKQIIRLKRFKSYHLNGKVRLNFVSKIKPRLCLICVKKISVKKGGACRFLVTIMWKRVKITPA